MSLNLRWHSYVDAQLITIKCSVHPLSASTSGCLEVKFMSLSFSACLCYPPLVFEQVLPAIMDHHGLCQRDVHGRVVEDYQGGDICVVDRDKMGRHNQETDVPSRAYFTC